MNSYQIEKKLDTLNAELESQGNDTGDIKAAFGAKADAACVDPTATDKSFMSFIKGIISLLVGKNTWAVTSASTANTAQTLTKAAVEGKSHYITAIEVAIKGNAAADDIDIVLTEDAAGTPIAKWSEVIGAGELRGASKGIVFNDPIKLAVNKTADLVVDAGGASVVTVANISGYTI
jgi:hypothetical protein